MPSKKSGGVRRLIVCDPTCALPYGHSVPAMVNFSRFVGRWFDEVILLGSKRLPAAIVEKTGIIPEFEFCYNEVLPLPKDKLASELPLTHSDKETVSKQDLVEVLDKYKVTGADTICFPSIDFYALLALSECLDEIKAHGSPLIAIRLIGVLENVASAIYLQHQAVTLALIQKVQLSNIPLTISAETPKYASYLAASLDTVVGVAANIEVGEHFPQTYSGVFNVICPGSARYDKGFLDLLEIFSSVRRRDLDLKIRFTMQVLPDKDLQYQMDYLKKLYSLPGTTLLPSKISTEEMIHLYELADLILLPYAKDVYAFRGSAVLSEALCAGRPVVAYSGSAFCDQLRFFDAGDLCQSPSEMSDLIISHSKISPQIRYAKARQSRKRFTYDLESSYKDWIRQ